VEDDPRKILNRAGKRPLRIAARLGGRRYHVSTIRHGSVNDPAWRASMPVTVSALKRHGVRILCLSSALQIALRIQLAKDSADAFFIEPGRECHEFAIARLSGSIDEVASFKRLLRHSRIAQATADAAAEQRGAQSSDEIESLTKRIGLLDRSLKKQIALSAKHEKSSADLRKARNDRAGADAAAKQIEAQQQDEIRRLKSRIGQLERSLKRRTAPEKESHDEPTVKQEVSDETLENGPIAKIGPDLL
jgi:HAMP domain-containing protein